MKTAMTVTFTLATGMKPDDVDWETVVAAVSEAIEDGVVGPESGGIDGDTTHVTRKGEYWRER